jgi:hypothetical protein
VQYNDVQKTCHNGKHALKNVNSCRNTIITFYLETSGGESSNLDLNVVYFINTSVK